MRLVTQPTQLVDVQLDRRWRFCFLFICICKQPLTPNCISSIFFSSLISLIAVATRSCVYSLSNRSINIYWELRRTQSSVAEVTDEP